MVHTQEPASLEAGTTWKWDRDFPEYPASEGWAISYVLRGPTAINITTVNTGSVYQVRVTPATNGAYKAGSYTAVAYAEKDGEKYRAWSGRFEVMQNLSTATDGLTFEEKTLEIIKLAIAGRLTADVQSYEIAGRAVTKIPIKELHELAGRYGYKVWRQRNPGRLMPTAEINFGNR